MPLPKKLFEKTPFLLHQMFKYKRSQYWNEERIDRYRVNKLKRLLYHAKNNVPHYSELFNKINLDPAEINSKADLKIIPILTRQDIIRDPDKFIAKNHSDFNSSWSHTSGTTGSPLSFLLDKKAELCRLASLLRCWSWTGYFPGKKVFSLQQGARAGFQGLKKLSRQRTLKLTATSLNRETAIQTHQELLKFKPDFYIAYPYSLVNFIRYGMENLDRIHKPETVICSGENLDDSQRSFIKTSLGARVFDFYSHEESVVMGMENGNGEKFLMEDFGIHEVIDENTGDPVRPGETGHLIGTGLNNYSMPFIRYRIEDKIQTLPPGDRSSGKVHFLQYKKLLGRKDGVICTPDGRKLSVLDDILHLKLEGIISSQLVQDTPEAVKLRIIKGEHFSFGNLPKIEKEMRDLISQDMKYEFEFVDKLETSKQGKTPFIISRLEQQE